MVKATFPTAFPLKLQQKVSDNVHQNQLSYLYVLVVCTLMILGSTASSGLGRDGFSTHPHCCCSKWALQASQDSISGTRISRLSLKHWDSSCKDQKTSVIFSSAVIPIEIEPFIPVIKQITTINTKENSFFFFSETTIYLIYFLRNEWWENYKITS